MNCPTKAGGWQQGSFEARLTLGDTPPFHQTLPNQGKLDLVLACQDPDGQ